MSPVSGPPRPSANGSNGGTPAVSKRTNVGSAENVGSAFLLPPSLWGRVGVGGASFSLPPCGGGRKVRSAGNGWRSVSKRLNRRGAPPTVPSANGPKRSPGSARFSPPLVMGSRVGVGRLRERDQPSPETDGEAPQCRGWYARRPQTDRAARHARPGPSANGGKQWDRPESRAVTARGSAPRAARPRACGRSGPRPAPPAAALRLPRPGAAATRPGPPAPAPPALPFAIG